MFRYEIIVRKFSLKIWESRQILEHGAPDSVTNRKVFSIGFEYAAGILWDLCCFDCGKINQINFSAAEKSSVEKKLLHLQQGNDSSWASRHAPQVPWIFDFLSHILNPNIVWYSARWKNVILDLECNYVTLKYKAFYSTMVFSRFWQIGFEKSTNKFSSEESLDLFPQEAINLMFCSFLVKLQVERENVNKHKMD